MTTIDRILKLPTDRHFSEFSKTCLYKYSPFAPKTFFRKLKNQWEHRVIWKVAQNKIFEAKGPVNRFIIIKSPFTWFRWISLYDHDLLFNCIQWILCKTLQLVENWNYLIKFLSFWSFLYFCYCLQSFENSKWWIVEKG